MEDVWVLCRRGGRESRGGRGEAINSCFGGKGKLRQKPGAVGSAEGSIVGFLYACPIVSTPRFISVLCLVGYFSLGGEAFFSLWVRKERGGVCIILHCLRNS